MEQEGHQVNEERRNGRFPVIALFSLVSAAALILAGGVTIGTIVEGLREHRQEDAHTGARMRLQALEVEQARIDARLSLIEFAKKYGHEHPGIDPDF